MATLRARFRARRAAGDRGQRRKRAVNLGPAHSTTWKHGSHGSDLIATVRFVKLVARIVRKVHHALRTCRGHDPWPETPSRNDHGQPDHCLGNVGQLLLIVGSLNAFRAESVMTLAWRSAPKSARELQPWHSPLAAYRSVLAPDWPHRSWPKRSGKSLPTGQAEEYDCLRPVVHAGRACGICGNPSGAWPLPRSLARPG